ncbi:MAG: long-chain fatty acid--CoA ligase [Solirubrobacterales bacterium]|nr:long-chain fatty acid--CoA ligase [Solirubrobacterales bacterium]
MTSTAATELSGKGVETATIAEAFRRTVAANRDEVALRTKDGSVSVTWGEYEQRVDAVAGGLAKLGLGRGQTMAILLANRPEFHIVDLAATTLGATPFSIYQTYAAGQIEYVCSDAQARIIVTEQAFLGNVLKARENLPELEHVIVLDTQAPSAAGTGGKAPEGCLSLADIEGSDPDFDAEAAWRAVDPEDVLTLIYTSGTTGPPKGVQLAHRNLIAAVQGIESLVQFPPNARVISWLPAAHIAERAAHHYLPVVFGLQVTSCPDPREIGEYLKEVHPTWFFAVPRIWEKIKAGLEAQLAQAPEEARAKVDQALQASLKKVRLEQADQEVPEELAAAVAQADEELFSNIRAMLGLDQLEAVNVGAAPTPVEVLEFFHAIGVPIAELWGMSETCGAGCCNPPDKIKLGTVGPPAPGVEVKLAQDGELLMRSNMVMLGYRNMDEQTAETIIDGWLYTGDIAEIDSDGYVKLVDRKKEIIINAAGKNMSPAYIESIIKASSPLIGQTAIIGDRRRFNTALVVLDADFAPMFAAQQGLQAKDLETLAADEGMRAAVQQAIDEANEKLSRVEQIKKFHLVRGDWLPGGDELTPTMKLKRKPIAAKYESEIEAMYAEQR